MLLFLLKLFATKNFPAMLTVSHPIGVMVIRLPFLGIFLIISDNPEMVTQSELGPNPSLYTVNPPIIFVNFKCDEQEERDELANNQYLHIT